MRSAARFVALTAALLPAVGCIVVAPPDPGPPGDISFLWSFDGETDCTAARVDEIDVLITDDEGNTARNLDRVTCSGGGLTIEDFDPGSYDVELEAYNDRGTLLFAGTATATVVSDTVADIGVIELARAGDAAKGDIAFYWDFDGVATCGAAGVAELDVELVDVTDNQSVLNVSEECFGGGLTLRDLDPGTYTLYVDAFDVGNNYLYAASVEVTVLAGQTTDLGVLVLDPVGQTGDMGVLSLDFGFIYPASAPESDCAIAGVTEVDIVLIDGPGGATLSRETILCDDVAVGVDLTLSPGTVDFYLEAFGVYDGDYVMLYDTADLSATVTADMANNLGQVELDRVSGNFSDVRFEHTLPQGETCASLGLTDLTYSITRLVGGTELLDDMGDFSCTDTFVLRETFVPGDYRVDIVGTGAGGISYEGSVTTDAAPGEEADATVGLSAN